MTSAWRKNREIIVKDMKGKEIRTAVTILGTETTIKFYDVRVNPTIPGSVFQPE